MARIRTLKPEFCTSEQLVQCSRDARLLFACMWCFCDDGGVHPASIHRLKMEVFPADDCTLAQVGAWVNELIDVGLIESYVVEGKEFWRVTGWHHQKIETPTYRYPRSKEFGDISTSVRRGLVDSSAAEGNGREWKGVESKGKEGKRTQSASADGQEKPTDTELLAWIRWWNALQSQGLVHGRTSEEPVSEVVSKAWNRVKRSKEVRALLSDRDALEREIRLGCFGNATWLTLTTLFGGKNQAGEYKAERLLAGAYRDMNRPKRAPVGAGVNFDPSAGKDDPNYGRL